MIWQRRSRRAGVTLPEMVTAIVVFGLIIGSVSAIYSASLRTWAQGTTEGYAQQHASWAVQRMAPDIRQGMSVTPGNAPFQACYIAIHLPNRIFNDTDQAHFNQILTTVDDGGHTVPYLVGGGYVLYYRGDANGNLALDGDHIWRKLLASDGTSVLKTDIIAEHIIDNPPDAFGVVPPLFVYWPDVYRLNSVEVTVTVQERQGSRTSLATMTGEFALRNR